MGLMVGSPVGRQYWGGGSLLLPPTIPCQSRRRVLYFVMGGPVDSVRDGVLPEG